MNRHSKRIATNFKQNISVIMANIENSNGRGFDGVGYPFQKAISNCRKNGLKIRYDRRICSYFLED